MSFHTVTLFNELNAIPLVVYIAPLFQVPSLSHGGAPVPFQKSACSGFSTETHTHENPQMGQQASFKEGGVPSLSHGGAPVPFQKSACSGFSTETHTHENPQMGQQASFKEGGVPSLSHGGAPVPFQKSACSGFSTETHTRKSPDGTAGVFQRGGGIQGRKGGGVGNGFGFALFQRMLLGFRSGPCVRFPLCPTVELLFPSKSLPVLDSPPKHTHENPQMGQQASFKEGGVPSLSHGGAPVPFQKSACSGFSTETHTRKSPDGTAGVFQRGGELGMVSVSPSFSECCLGFALALVLGSGCCFALFLLGCNWFGFVLVVQLLFRCRPRSPEFKLVV
ncbi:hypothetical protein TNCT_471021 [Trichonephila clavata]|uniref:Transmembrane protein n=1 Tax=Trichonephila clavata TaxID=2740835 RepID=A0A8X6L7G0_TRICU|nr:hypothetical protein TNCT_471021 [Trichonephila clavata]